MSCPLTLCCSCISTMVACERVPKDNGFPSQRCSFRNGVARADAVDAKRKNRFVIKNRWPSLKSEISTTSRSPGNGVVWSEKRPLCLPFDSMSRPHSRGGLQSARMPKGPALAARCCWFRVDGKICLHCSIQTSYPPTDMMYRWSSEKARPSIAEECPAYTTLLTSEPTAGYRKTRRQPSSSPDTRQSRMGETATALMSDKE